MNTIDIQDLVQNATVVLDRVVLRANSS